MKRRRMVTFGCVSTALALSAWFAATGSPAGESASASSSEAASASSASSSESARGDRAEVDERVPDEGTPEGFLHTWVEEKNRVQSGGDLPRFLLMSRGCDPCMEFALRNRDIYANGGHVETDGWEVLEVQPLELNGETFTYELRANVAAGSYVERSGADEVTYDESVVTFELDLTRHGHTWNVDDYTQYAG